MPSSLADSSQANRCQCLQLWPESRAASSSIVSLTTRSSAFPNFLLPYDRESRAFDLEFWSFSGAWSLEFGVLIYGCRIRLSPMESAEEVLRRRVDRWGRGLSRAFRCRNQ